MFNAPGNYSNQGLPYRYDALDRQPMQVNPANPPFVPQNIDCTNDVRGLLPLISGTLINLIGQSASNNHLRAFTFNQLSDNNFANQAFQDLVATTVQILMVHAYSGQNQFSDSQALVTFSANKALEIFIAINVSRFPPLQSLLANNQANQISQLLNEFNQYRNSVEQLKRQMSTPQNQFGAPQGGFVPGQGPSLGGSGFNRFNTGFNRPAAGVGHFGGGNGAGSTVFNEPIRTPSSVGGGSFGEAGTSRFASRAPVEMIEEVKITPVAPARIVVPVAEVITSEALPIEEADFKWKRSDTQPYPIISRFSTEQIYIQKTDKGSILTKKPRTKTVFEYDKHTALTSLRVYSSHEKLKSVTLINDEAAEVLDAVEAPTKKLSDEELSTLVTVTEPSNILYDGKRTVKSLEDALFEHMFLTHAAREVNEEATNLAISANYLLITCLGKSDDEDVALLGELHNARTLLEFRAKLDQALESWPRMFWTRVENKATKLVNSVLKQQLALDIKIDSFFSDYEDLLGALGQYSETVLSTFLKIEREIIHQVTYNDSDDTINTKVQTSQCMRSYGGKLLPANYSFLVSHLTLVSLDIDSEGLDLNLAQERACAIDKDASPILYSLAKKLFTKITRSVTLIYVQLSDGVTLKLDRGLFGEETYLVNIYSR